ncbi:MAG: prenyltransferase [Chloroflexi bacterium]|nr:prenyltransferase [Chloroflexota bacterium]
MAEERVATEQRASRPSLRSRWYREIRAPFLTASIVPVLLGTTLAWARGGGWSWGLFLLAMMGAVLLHIGTNVLNDYFDYRAGTDNVNFEFLRPYSGGSRMIQLQMMSPREVLLEAILAFAGATIVGVALLFLVGLPILYFGLVGMLSGILYTVWLVKIGIGEVFVGLNFGVLMTVGAYYVQTRTISTEVAVASIPIALLIALVLFINQFQDYQADKATGKRHLVVRMGRARSAWVYVAGLAATYVSLVVGVAAFGVTPFALLALVTVPIAWKAVRTARRFYDDYLRLAPANQATIMVHMFVGLLMTVGYLIQRAVG